MCFFQQVCGQHCPTAQLRNVRTVLGFDHSTVCLETVMAQCYTELSEKEMDHMFLHAPEVISKIRSEGAVSDTFLDALGIAKLSGGNHINRDELVTWRQHAHVMSHSSSKAKFVDYLKLRADRNNPALQLQIKERDKAAKVLQRVAAAKEKLERNIRDKEAELKRRLNLSPDALISENAEKKRVKADKKEALIQKKAERVREAAAIVAAGLVVNEV